MIGFKDSYPGDQKYLRCSQHKGTVLIKDPMNPDIWLCPECGLSHVEEELETITAPQSKFGNKKGKMLMQPDKKKVLRAEDGSEIPEDDTLTIHEMQQGLRVLKYHEEKVEVMKKII